MTYWIQHPKLRPQQEEQETGPRQNERLLCIEGHSPRGRGDRSLGDTPAGLHPIRTGPPNTCRTPASQQRSPRLNKYRPGLRWTFCTDGQRAHGDAQQPSSRCESAPERASSQPTRTVPVRKGGSGEGGRRWGTGTPGTAGAMWNGAVATGNGMAVPPRVNHRVMARPSNSTSGHRPNMTETRGWNRSPHPHVPVALPTAANTWEQPEGPWTEDGHTACGPSARGPHPP